jgi:ATP synthase protein I
MPKVDDPHEEATSLDARLDALEARRAAAKPFALSAEKASSDGYRVLADLIGGVLVGLGFGWLIDHFAGTGPLCMIGGLLIGMGFSVFTIVRRAGRMSAKAASPAKAAAPAADDDEDRPGVFGPREGDD